MQGCTATSKHSETHRQTYRSCGTYDQRGTRGYVCVCGSSGQQTVHASLLRGFVKRRCLLLTGQARRRGATPQIEHLHLDTLLSHSSALRFQDVVRRAPDHRRASAWQCAREFAVRGVLQLWTRSLSYEESDLQRLMQHATNSGRLWVDEKTCDVEAVTHLLDCSEETGMIGEGQEATGQHHVHFIAPLCRSK